MDKQFEHTKEMYLAFKKILERLSKQDVVGRALASALTIEQIITMQEFVIECNDMGFGLVTREVN